MFFIKRHTISIVMPSQICIKFESHQFDIKVQKPFLEKLQIVPSSLFKEGKTKKETTENVLRTGFWGAKLETIAAGINVYSVYTYA